MAGVWTKNFQALKNIWLCGDANYYLSCLKDKDGNLNWTVSDTINYHNYELPVTSPMAYCSAGEVTGLVSNARIFLGSGATTPAVTDYALTEEIAGISYLSVVNEKPVWNDNTGEVSNTVKLTVQAGNAEVTIREWGLFVRIPFYRGNSGWSHRYLVYHATLDTPVTLAPSQSAMLTLVRTVILTDPVSWPE